MTSTKPAASAPETAAKPRRRFKIKGWLLFLAALLAAAAFLLPRVLPSQRVPDRASSGYQLQPVATRTIVNSLTGSGTLQPANSYTVTTLVQGEILSAPFEEGDLVEQDALLYQIDSSDAATNIERAQISLNQAQRNYQNAADAQYIYAPSSGTLHQLDAAEGDETRQGQTLAAIRDSDVMTLTLPFLADDAASFSAGQPASVTLDSSFETLPGTVQSVSGASSANAQGILTRDVTIAVENPGGLSPAQSARANVDGLQCAGSGTFTFRSESTVSADSAGTITAVHAAEGERVEKGQLLFTLGGDALDSQLQNAADNLRTAQLSMESTQEQLDGYAITSPIRGTVINKEYKTGDTIESGKSLCTIYDLSYLVMTLNIDELDIASVAVGQTVSITADAVEGGVFQGTVTKVSVAGSTSGGITSYPVTVRIDETGGLLPGMNVDAEILLSQAENVLAVPNEAVVRGADRALALVTADSPSAVHAAQREAPDGYVYVPVETGVSDDSYVEITSGLQEGDQVAYLRQSSSGQDFMMGGPMGMPGGAMPSGGGMPGGGGPGGNRGGGGPR